MKTKWTLFAFAIILITTVYSQNEMGSKMNFTDFYNIPENSRISKITFEENLGFVAVDKNENTLFIIMNYDNGPDYVSENLIRIIDTNKIGFADLNANVIIPPSFDFALPFQDGLSAVCKGCKVEKENEHSKIIGGKWGFVNKSGELAIEYTYDRIDENFSNGHALVSDGNESYIIDKSGRESDVKSEIYDDWVEVIKLSSELIVVEHIDGEYSVKVEKSSNDNFILSQNNSYYQLNFINPPGQKKLKKYYLLPWTDITVKQNENIITTDQLFTVTEDFIVYTSDSEMPSDEDESVAVKIFEKYFKQIIQFEKYSNLQEKELNIKPDVQVISAKVYNCYVDLDVASPGTKMPEMDKWREISEDRMVYLKLVPDIGLINEKWIKTEKDVEKEFKQVIEKEVIPIFKKALNNALVNPHNRKDIFEKAKSDLNELMKKNRTTDAKLPSYYEEKLFALFQLTREKSAEEHTVEEIFEDYSPKTTPDTIIDYMPELEEVILQIPAPAKENLPSLIEQLLEFNELAKVNPGVWQDGNILLGANEKEYKPTKEELIASEIGCRIEQALKSISDDDLAEISGPVGLSKLTFKKFSFRHADVMGSGRFFYVDRIEEVELKLIQN